MNTNRPEGVNREVEAALERCKSGMSGLLDWQRFDPTEAMDDEYFAGCERLDAEALATLRSTIESLASEHAALLEVAKAAQREKWSGNCHGFAAEMGSEFDKRTRAALEALPDTLKSQLSEEVGK